MTRKISHSKNTLIFKAFQSRVKWRFSFCDIFFRSRDIQVFLLYKFSQWWCHRLCKYSGVHTKIRISPPIMQQCYWNLAVMLPSMKYTRWYTFWCCFGKMLGSSLLPYHNEIFPFATQQGDACQPHLHWVSSFTFLTVFFALCSYKW